MNRNAYIGIILIITVWVFSRIYTDNGFGSLVREPKELTTIGPRMPDGSLYPIDKLPTKPAQKTYKLPPLGTKIPPKYDFTMPLPPPVWASGEDPCKDNRHSGSNAPIPSMPPGPPMFDDSPYTKGGFGYSGAKYIRGPYLDRTQRLTLIHKGLLPGAVPSPAVTYNRYFIFARVTPATSKIWVVAPKSVSPSLLFEHMMQLRYNTEPDRHTYVIQDSGYTVAMVVGDKTKLGLLSYQDTLPIRQIKQMLNRQGVETPGIYELPHWVKMHPAVIPDQQTAVMGVYDLARHPELEQAVVSAHLRLQNLWPLFGLCIGPLYLLLLPLSLFRTQSTPEEMRAAEIVNISTRSMVYTYLVMLIMIPISITGVLRILPMWFEQDRVTGVYGIAAAISFLIPVIVNTLVKDMVRRKSAVNTECPEIRRMYTIYPVIYMFIIIMYFVVLITSWRWVPYQLHPYMPAILMFIGAVLTTLVCGKQIGDYSKLLLTISPDEQARLTSIHDAVSEAIMLRGYTCPDLALMNCALASTFYVSVINHKRLGISRAAFISLSDDELVFFLSHRMITEKLSLELYSITAFLFACLIVVSDILSIPILSGDIGTIILPIVVFGEWVIPYYAKGLVIQRADRLTVELTGNLPAAISAIHKLHDADVDKRAVTLRLRDLEKHKPVTASTPNV